MKHTALTLATLLLISVISCAPLATDSIPDEDSGTAERKIKESKTEVFTTSGNTVQISTYEYDGDRVKCISVTQDGSPVSRVEYSYEPGLRIMAIYSYNNGEWTLTSTTSTYFSGNSDNADRIVTEQNVNGQSIVSSQVYEYDKDGNPSSVVIYSNDQMSSKTEYSYSGATTVSIISLYSNDQWIPYYSITSTYSDNTRSKILESISQTLLGGQSTSKDVYEYDGDDLILVNHYIQDVLNAKTEYSYTPTTTVSTYSVMSSGSWSVYYINTVTYFE